jgi:hypothetical protein
VSVREHTFYIYAVDDKGKPDATPAHFMFRAYDRFPPLASIDSAVAVGTVFDLVAGGGVAPRVGRYYVTDSFDVARPFPRDTVPSTATLTFYWHGEATTPGGDVSGYRYKLDEPTFNVVDASVTSARYNTHIGSDVVSPGIKKFTLRAVGRSGWRGESTRYFQMNFAPDSWFSGPDVSDPAAGWSSYADGNGKRYYYKNVNWQSFSGIPNTMLSSDSVNVLPAARPVRRTFFEFYADRIWAHQEGDTVSLNSWVLIPSGGYDPDSPYLVNVGVNPATPPGVVTRRSSEPNGSPIGFVANITTVKPDEAGGGGVRPTESTLYPIFDLVSVYNQEKMSYRGAMTTSGKAYAYVAAADADGAVDRRLRKAGGAEKVADDVDSGSGDPEEVAVRSKVLVFYVNHAPSVDVGAIGFVPKPGSTIRGVNQTFTLFCSDIDPIDDTKTATIGGPQSPPAPVLVKTVDLIQQHAGTDSVQNVCTEFEGQNPNFNPDPSKFQNGPMIVRVKLSDGRANSTSNFSRRTVVVDIPVTYNVTAPADITTGTGSTNSQSTQRPGSPQAAVRRQ